MQNQTRNVVIVALTAALVSVTCWNQSTGQVATPAKAVSVQQWEYMTAPANKTGSETLTSATRGGWEVCAAYSQGTIDKDGGGEIVGYAILRRPKASK
jgi:hypothetical protein